MSNENRPESFDERFRRKSHSFLNEDEDKDNNEEMKENSGVEKETYAPKETNDFYEEPRTDKRGGCFSSLLIPLLAGIVGAVLVVVLYHNFFNGDTPVTDNNRNQTESKELSEVKKDLEKEHRDKVITDTTAAVKKASPAVVSVINLQETQSLYGLDAGKIEEAGSGSGVIYKIDENNAYIVTNNHVIEGASELKVNLESGQSIPAELIGADIWTDLAVLRIERGNIDVAIEFADSDKILVGEDAIAIGSPLGAMFSGSVSRGIVSALDRAIPVDFDNDGSIDWEASVLQTDAAINPGNSGGALINSSGDLIGINSMKIGTDNVEGIGFAIPSNEVARIIKDLEEFGEVKRPFLGVSMMDIYTISSEILQGQLNLPEEVTMGALVTGVQENSPANQAELRAYDLIVSLDGEAIENSLKLRRYLYEKKEIGDDITIEFYRDGKKQTTKATLE
ncbi:S1C family serine protease [Phocicoccus pinnipedialis]|uniref:Serine protease Do-like HtrA n=1 Tax=Phocicoccus pinnipedialis TaxID=110845 RepID=A0A6V7R872_9BACL|nr:S1C family serine protease [Jeotgalicoccus pinnipedialis]MBP1938946.1 serine protease Do [Jeotgalicoccus pinnipedialis]CAD2073214.1 Serine protease Do-like HtrA [Jeotgalicoccus pinnipedialis]